MSEFDAIATCESAADGGLDGAVTVWVDGAVSSFAGLADGDHRLGATGAEAAYAIDAAVSCDTDLPTASIVVAGVGTAPLPAALEPQALSATVVDAGALAPAAVQLPSTGAPAGAMLAASLALVAVGGALRRLGRPAA